MKPLRIVSIHDDDDTPCSEVLFLGDTYFVFGVPWETGVRFGTHGLCSDEQRESLVRDFCESINLLTGHHPVVSSLYVEYGAT